MPKFRLVKVYSENIKSERREHTTLSLIITLFSVFIISVISFYLANHFVPNTEYAKIIIESAIVIAGFGLLVFQINRPTDPHWKEWFSSLKIATLFSLWSVLLSFLYLIFFNPSFFLLSTFLLFASIGIIILFVSFHQSKLIY